jgi:hypothetical protein
LVEIIGCSSANRGVLDDLDVDEADVEHHVAGIFVETRNNTTRSDASDMVSFGLLK